jgi:GNAT superfamily N-acetyltransferase
MKVEIREVTNHKELRKFVKFAINLYKDHPHYVPDLIDEAMTTLDRKRNPAFEFSESIYFLALIDGKIVGRIAGIINHKANDIWKIKQARFGFVDFIDDSEVVDALFAAVEEWARLKGMEELTGPLGFTDLDNEGMLIDGFDHIGTMATIYNYPYYPEQMERMGYVKACDWHEFKIYIPEGIPDKHKRIANIVRQKYGLKTMKFRRRKEIWPYANKIFKALNAAFAPLYGVSPLSEKQIEYYIKMYIPMLRLDLITVIVREADDEVVGFGITLPNLSKAMQRSRGSLFPFGFIHLLRTLYSKPKVVDLYLTGVIPEYQGKGVNALLFDDLIPVYIKMGTEYAESNPELETNNAVQAQWDYFRREHHKTRRAFTKKL